MKFTISQIAQIISAKVEGNEQAEIYTICKIEKGVEGGITFLANPKYTRYIYDTKATAVIVNDDFIPEKPLATILIRTPNAYLAIAKLLEFYNSLKNSKSGISEKAAIASSAKIGKDVYIADFVSIGEEAVIEDHAKLYPHVYVGDRVSIGESTILYSGVKVYDECIIGKSCIIHAGTVIGSDGFGFAQQDDQYMKIPQIGNVVIEAHVEIGANCCIDRAMIGSTVIGKNVKLDNLIQIAHNVEIGEGTAMASQVGISGSTKIGAQCIFAGQVGVAGHITIGDKVIVAAQSGVTNNIENQAIVLGSPAIPILNEKKLIIYRKKLPELFQKVNDLEKKVTGHPPST